MPDEVEVDLSDFVEIDSDSRQRVMPQPEFTTLWDFQTQSDSKVKGGNHQYPGVTPARIIYNFLHLYTQEGDLVVDPFCGSGTTLDVASAMKRRSRGFDLYQNHPEVQICSATEFSQHLESGSVDAVFADSPYGDNLDYGDSPSDLGKISANSPLFIAKMGEVAGQIHRVLKPGGYLGWLISDEWKRIAFVPLGFRIFSLLEQFFVAEDIVCVTRKNDSGTTGRAVYRAKKNKYMLRGFKYLLIFKKEDHE
jgi:DNA modification methylase